MAKQVDGICYFTIGEAAQQLGISPSVLRSRVRQGRLKSDRIGLAELISEKTLKNYQANLKS